MRATTVEPGRREAPVRVIRPGDDDWNTACGVFNVLVDQKPAAIAYPTTAQEVAAAIAYAREHGLRVAPQTTGHGAASFDDLAGTLLLKTSALTGVEIDAEARRVRVGAASRWRDLGPQLSELGLAALHGSSPDVGIPGYSLGGGIGWLARKHGLQANAVTAIELVTAEGELITASPDSHAELFWALRGGGGSFAVVTALEFEVFPVAELAAGALFFPIERAQAVLDTWTRMLPALPEELTTWAVLLHFPPVEEVPEAVRGREFAIVMAAFLGPEDEGRRLLSPLLELGPVMDSFTTGPTGSLAQLAMDPEAPLPFRSATALLDGLSPAAIAAIAELGGAGSPLTLVQLRHGGGALARRSAGAGVRADLAGEIVLFALGVAPDPAVEAIVTDRLGRLSDAVAPHRVGDYANLVEEPTDASRFFDAETWARLCAVKAAYDPDDLIRGNHHVAPV